MGLFSFLNRNTSPSIDSRFVGEWKLLKSDGSLEPGESVTMNFHENGNLTYVVHLNGSRQTMNLVYSVEGDRLITDQPSHPRKDTTKFEFDVDGNLILDYGGNRSWFVRIN